jgi:calpain-7
LNRWPTLCQLASSKAAKAEFAKEYDQAFRLYIKAAESFLHLSRSPTQSDKSKQQWKANAAKALERAERIKKFVAATSNTPASLRLTPVAINHFSPRKSFKSLQFPVFSSSQRNNYTF